MEPTSISGIRVPAGARKDVRLRLGEGYAATPVTIPVCVLHGVEPGPRLFVTSAIHGDEINGVEIVRRLRAQINPQHLRGTVLLVPIVNVIAFVRHERDLPDGRDLNRSFPGSPRGSMASRIAAAVFRKVIRGCDFGIDLHTAAHGRSNYPHVRADMRSQATRRLACAFGTEFIVDMPGQKGMLRHEATRRGIPTIVFEAGAPLRFQNGVVERGVDGIWNILGELGMMRAARRSPKFNTVIHEREWVRAQNGGILALKVKPGDIIEKGSVIAVTTRPLGTKEREILAPFDGLVMGTATLPMVQPGSAVCHLVSLGSRLRTVRRLLKVPKDLFE